MTEPGASAKVPLRVAVGAATLAAGAALIAAIVNFAAGAITLPASYACLAVVAGAAAVVSRRVALCGGAAVLVVGLAVADAATRGAASAFPPAVRTWSDPAGVVVVPLPVEWIEDIEAHVDRQDVWIRQYRPAGGEPDTAPHLQVSVMRTTNNGRAALEALPGLQLLTDVQRGPARGHRWRRVADGFGEVGIELHHAGWRLYVHFRAGLESRFGARTFDDLRAVGEAVCDRLQPAARTWFQRRDREWFGR